MEPRCGTKLRLATGHHEKAQPHRVMPMATSNTVPNATSVAPSTRCSVMLRGLVARAARGAVLGRAVGL